jgi:hypothetical protein
VTLVHLGLRSALMTAPVGLRIVVFVPKDSEECKWVSKWDCCFGGLALKSTLSFTQLLSDC